ncbi:MAG: AraC family transcriptional regulator [Treponema sp.]|jgi:AraC family transcriptional regulator|nr:AraC family transcriptional regulator [Treponema sp.]
MVRYIDAHIKEKLNVEKLAARAGFSPYHFCRVFQWEVGYSLMEYVRTRRLFYAASELASGKRIVDIALDYGFETHSGFSKAFRRYFDCSPEKYRAHASFDIPKLPVLKKTKHYVHGGIVMEPKMLKKEALTLAGFALKTRTKNGENKREIPKFWQAYSADGRMEKLHHEAFLKSHTEYGVCFFENPENGEFVYVIGVEVKEGSAIPEGYHICTVPEALYAVFTTPPADESHFIPSIQGTWNYIHSEWFPNSGYEFDRNGVDFELYDERCMPETGKSIAIYIPVVKKQREH